MVNLKGRIELLSLFLKPIETVKAVYCIEHHLAKHTQCNEVLSFSWLSCSHRSIVEQQAIGRLCDELQRNLALKARLYGREPSITIS